MQILDREVAQIKHTARSAGAVGRNALLPRFIADKPQHKDDRILDFGCGPTAQHVVMLREKGFKYVYGIDFHNIDSGLVSKYPGYVPWEIVYASNVLNVQPSHTALHSTIQEVAGFARYGVAYFNYPKTPRKLPLMKSEIRNMLSPYFLVVHIFTYRKAIIFKCIGKRFKENGQTP